MYLSQYNYLYCKMSAQLVQLRHELHRHPELSGKETATANRIVEFAKAYQPSQIISGIGGHGLAIVYAYGDGPAVMIRCELDALPIAEANDFVYRSVNPGVSHKCGHDGHMTIVAGLCPWLQQQQFKKGKVIMLFQPAEETGQGAAAVLKDPAFASIRPDYVFALHNLPGEELHHIIIVNGQYSATVQSVALHFRGRQAHASEPEKGCSPAAAMASVTQQLAGLNITDANRKDFTLLTPVYTRMGSPDYGIAAGEGELHYTLRTWSSGAMERLKEKVVAVAREECARHQLAFSTEWFDYFPASINNHECNSLIRRVAKANGFTVIEKTTPFRFGEDFGWYSQQYPTAMFGIGAGTNMPSLHQDDYDFPDELIDTGIRMFAGIIEQLLNK
jgi:amidohydrolase